MQFCQKALLFRSIGKGWMRRESAGICGLSASTDKRSAARRLWMCVCWAAHRAGLAGLLYHNGNKRQNGIKGGFLGQVQRGRAQRSLELRCGLVAAGLWAGLLTVGGQADAQAPAAATTTQAQQVPAAGAKAGDTQVVADAPGLTTSVWEWKGLR